MDIYLQEYNADEAVARYTSRTAGSGIGYLLENDYAEVYLSAISDFLRVRSERPLRLLEFGCGGGMNIITLLKLLERRGRSIELAIGADFSQKLILAAQDESRSLLDRAQQEKMHFALARNETIAADLRRALNGSAGELENSFHLILGVNTFRYCHRLGKARDCARDLATLLAPGAICIIVDMNRRFPAFRSRFRDRRTKPEAERYLPSLDEYAAPFEESGLEVLRKETFCWIPHSAGARLTRFCHLLTPVLNLFAKPMAMRSLVISRKRLL